MDQWSLLSRLQTLAYQVIPQWDDFSLNFPENVLLEAQARLVAMAASVLNERCRQAFKATVTDRLAMIRLAQPFGYTLAGATAAQVSGTFYLPNSAVATKKVILPEGTRLASGDARFQLLAALEILVGANASASTTLENSETHVESSASDDSANMVLPLSVENVIEDSIEVLASDGAYSRYLDPGVDSKPIKSFIEVGPDTKAFVPMTDASGRAYVYFGNSINGKIPTGTIQITYKTGGGEAGRVAAAAAWQVLDAIYDEDGNLVTVLFQNPTASTAGYDQTSVAEARVRAPLALRTLERCVNEEDLEYVARLTGGIARAAAVTSDQPNTGVSEDEAYLYCVAYGAPYSDSGYYPPATPTAAQLSSIAAMIDTETGTYPHIMGTAVTALPAIFRDITVKVKIYKSSGYTAATVKANIVQSLQKFFAVADDERAPTEIDFGYKLLDANGDPDYKIAWSKVLNVINDTAGVREISFVGDNLLLNDIRMSVVLSAAEFPRLSEITVYDMDNSGVAI